MKILFVEDELSKNIPRIIRLFSKFLNNRQIKQLKALESDPSGYGASPEEVKAIVDESGIVEVDFKFPEALRKIIQHHDRFALFIVDRNLVEDDYHHDEAVAIDPTFSETQYEIYCEREGDYLLYKLAFKGVDVRQKFFFMTAYDAKSELKNAAGLEEVIGTLGDFKANNFIEKGKEEHLKRLQKMIENHKTIGQIAEHQHHVKMLHKYLDQGTADRFIKILLEKDNDKRIDIDGNLNEIRQIYQKILSGCCAKIPGMTSACVDNHGNVDLGKKTLDWLDDNGHINSIIRNHSFSIKTICSDFGSHDNPTRKIFSPSIDTVNALFFALKDIIGWFGTICNKFK